MKSAVIMLSGGLDSSTVAYMAREDVGKKGKVYPLAFMYGQRHVHELQCANKIAFTLGSELKVATVGLNKLIESSLVGTSEVPTEGVDPTKIPSTWVPQRNAIFLALAFAYAETVNADAVYAGMNVLDYSGYPDCRPDFLIAISKALNLASKRFVETGKGIGLIAPLIKMTKADIVKKGTDLGVPYGLTWSCYQGPNELGQACGVCDSCRLRLKGFAEADLVDPLKYAEVK